MALGERNQHVHLMNTANPLHPPSDKNWGRGQWSRADLDGKTVTFSVSMVGHINPGTGWFAVTPRPQDSIEVEILSENWIGSDLKPLRFPLTPELVAQIQKHPNSEVAEFRLLKPLSKGTPAVTVI